MKLLSAAELLAGEGNIEYLVDGLLPLGYCALMAGESGIGKSWLALYLARRDMVHPSTDTAIVEHD